MNSILKSALAIALLAAGLSQSKAQTITNTNLVISVAFTLTADVLSGTNLSFPSIKDKDIIEAIQGANTNIPASLPGATLVVRKPIGGGSATFYILYGKGLQDTNYINVSAYLSESEVFHVKGLLSNGKTAKFSIVEVTLNTPTLSFALQGYVAPGTGSLQVRHIGPITVAENINAGALAGEGNIPGSLNSDTYNAVIHGTVTTKLIDAIEIPITPGD